MATTWVETQVTWSSASSITVSSATAQVSDEFILNSECVCFGLQLSADNQAGSPVSGDTAKFQILWSSGDILGDSGNDYDTTEHGMFVTTLDTFATNTPGEDPARKTLQIQPFTTKFKIAVTCAQAATNNMVIRARVVEQRLA